MEQILAKLEAIDWIILGGRMLAAIAVLVIGFWIVKALTNGLDKLLNKKGMDKSLQGFLMSLVGSILKFIVIIAGAGTLGMNLGALATIVAAAGFAIGMALQGSLSNIAGGALIMVFKPFKVGDYIAAQGKEGVVKQIEIFTTKINTTDNKEIIIPNGILSNGNITNFSSENKRRVDIVFGVSYDADIKETRDVLLSVINGYEKTLKSPAPSARVSELADSSVNFTTKTWVNTEDYWDAYHYILENTKLALDKAGIEIPYPTSVEIEKQA